MSRSFKLKLSAVFALGACLLLFQNFSSTYAPFVAKTVSCSKTTLNGVVTETCSARAMPELNQAKVPGIGAVACAPTAWASILGTYYNAGLIDISASKYHTLADITVASKLSVAMKTTTASGGTLPANELTAVNTALANLRASATAARGFEYGRMGFGGSTAFTPARLTPLIRQGRWGALWIGFYDYKSAVLLSGVKVATYNRNGGHVVATKGFTLKGTDYTNGFTLRVMDPKQLVKTAARLRKYSEINPTIGTAKFYVGSTLPYTSLSAGSAYVFTATELPADGSDERIVEGLTSVAAYTP